MFSVFENLRLAVADPAASGINVQNYFIHASSTPQLSKNLRLAVAAHAASGINLLKVYKRRMLCRTECSLFVHTMILVGSAVGLYAVVLERPYPHYTVSDALSTPSGFCALYSGWVVGAVFYTTNREYIRTSIVALCAPLFPLPMGQPILSKHGLDAPVVATLHVAWAACFIHAIILDRMIHALPARCLGLIFVVCYTGGVMHDVPILAIVGCVAEWALVVQHSIRSVAHRCCILHLQYGTTKTHA
jgi:hypothetical protein